MSEPDFFEALAAPFPADRISWRVGATTGDKSKGMALAYIDARDVMERLDEVCGPAGWQCRYPHANGKTVCEVGIKIGGEWIWKSDGAGDTDHEAEKGALSDAFKRAAVRWGVGRYLYDMESPWVEIEQRGRSYAIKKEATGELRKVAMAAATALEWGSPEARATLRVLLNTIKRLLQTEDDVRRWREENAGTLNQMRVKARELVEEHLNRITDQSQAKAA